MRHALRLRSGFTLTELAIVLGIIGLILGAIWTAAAAVYQNMRVTNAVRDIQTITYNTQNLIPASQAADLDDGGVMTPTLYQAGGFPADWAYDSTTGNAISPYPYGEAIIYDTVEISGGGRAYFFAIAISNVPVSDCVQIGYQTAATAKATGHIDGTCNNGNLCIISASGTCGGAGSGIDFGALIGVTLSQVAAMCESVGVPNVCLEIVHGYIQQ
jgi:prepilin-type N-terminal cleavage/methylation domain-containing protein